MKVWSRMFAMNVQSISIQQRNWNVISQFTLTTNSSAVFCATQSVNVNTMLSITPRSVLLYTVCTPLCCDYEQLADRWTVSAAEDLLCFTLWLRFWGVRRWLNKLCRLTFLQSQHTLVIVCMRKCVSFCLEQISRKLPVFHFKST